MLCAVTGYGPNNRSPFPAGAGVLACQPLTGITSSPTHVLANSEQATKEKAFFALTPFVRLWDRLECAH
jgi:hypothetical protein